MHHLFSLPLLPICSTLQMFVRPLFFIPKYSRQSSNRSDGRILVPPHQPNGPTIVSSCPLASNLIMLSPFSIRLSIAVPQSCSIAGLEETEGGSASAIAPSCPLVGSQLPPAPVRSKVAVSLGQSANDAKLHRRARRNGGRLRFDYRT
jgi:hypothetical protein